MEIYVYRRERERERDVLGFSGVFQDGAEPQPLLSVLFLELSVLLLQRLREEDEFGR
jgi:hypothetical protein